MSLLKIFKIFEKLYTVPARIGRSGALRTFCRQKRRGEFLRYCANINGLLFRVATFMSVGSGDKGGGEAWPTPWIFIHDTDIVDRSLIVLFFVFFSVASLLPLPPF